ncbi:transposable element Tcb2 transposase [Trichonephila clavipes]|nr:transposable element Tcb2 transposase [Trichonephila clavipes]
MSTMSQRSHLTDSEAWRVVGRRPGQGRRWATTPNEDHYLVLTARRHRNMNATLLQQHLRSATGTTGFQLRLSETVSMVDRGSRNNPAFVHESVRFGGGGVLVYGGISIDGRTDLYIIGDRPLTARRYRDEILRPIVVPYAAAIGDDFILMDDNCRPHHMNPIEYVWDALRRRVAGRQPPHKLSKNWKELFWKSGTEYPNSRLIASLTPCPKAGVVALRAIGHREADHIQYDAAEALEISQSAFSRLRKQFLETGNVFQRLEQGRTPAAKQIEDR